MQLVQRNNPGAEQRKAVVDVMQNAVTDFLNAAPSLIFSPLECSTNCHECRTAVADRLKSPFST
jgi:hypothetical protein